MLVDLVMFFFMRIKIMIRIKKLNFQMIWVFIKVLTNTIQIKNKKMLIVFDDMVADKLSNKKLNPIVIELFIRGRK